MAALEIKLTRAARASRKITYGERLAYFVASMLLTAGFICSGLELVFDSVQIQVALPALICAALVSLAISLTQGKRRLYRLVLLIIAAIVVLLIIMGLVTGLLNLGVGYIAQAIQDLIINLTGEYMIPVALADVAGLTLTMCIVGILFTALITWAVSRNASIFAVVLALLPVMAAIAGWMNFSVFTILGIAGAFVAITVSNVSSIAWVPKWAFAVTTVALIVFITAISTLSGLVARNATPDVTDARNWITSTWDWFFSGPDGALPDGDIAGSGSFNPSDRVELIVTGSISQGGLYLKGFVGAEYSDGVWTGVSNETRAENGALFYWLDADGFYPQGQLSLAADAASWELDVATMTIENVSGRTDRLYLPYSYSTSGGTSAEELGLSSNESKTNELSSAQAYSFEVYSDVLSQAYVLQLELEAGGDVAYLADEEAYREYVYEQYLTIPADVAETIEDVLGPALLLSPDQAKALARLYFETFDTYDASYSSSYYSNYDPVTEFLNGDTRGYSIHYASAAAMILRYYGVPTRYVEGYYVPEGYSSASATNDETDDKDGADSATNSIEDTDATAANADDSFTVSTGTFELTGYQSHAWVEYYLDGVGWIPFDPTPGYGDDSIYDFSDRVEQIEDSDLAGMLSAFAESSSSWQPQVEDDRQNQIEDEQPQDEPDQLWIVWMIVALIVLLTLALIARIAYITIRLTRFWNRLRTEDPAWAASTAFSYAILLMRRCLGCEFGPAPLSEQLDKVAEAGLDTEAFLKATRINDKARFSASGVTEDERMEMVRYASKISAECFKHSSIIRRFVDRWVLGLYV